MPETPDPGKTLRQLIGLRQLTLEQVAILLGMSRWVLNKLLRGKGRFSPSICVGLQKAGLGKAKYWAHKQAERDLAQYRQQQLHGPEQPPA